MDGSLEKNLREVNQLIIQACERAQRQDHPTLIAVSKKQPTEKIRDLYQLGIRDFGENYLKEALEKMQDLKELSLQWHYIGQIQSKKIPKLVDHFDWIHSVSSLEELEKIDQDAEEKNKIQNCLLQINIAGEESKQGFSLTDFADFLSSPTPHQNVNLAGMMIFPPLLEDEKSTRTFFKQGFELFQQAQKILGPPFCKLSMGTSQDFMWAIEEGAHFIRVGERIFGPRH